MEIFIRYRYIRHSCVTRASPFYAIAYLMLTFPTARKIVNDVNLPRKLQYNPLRIPSIKVFYARVTLSDEVIRL